ncbi:MAG: hypothetical protein LC642_06715 [Verrucomicrobiaceae bacterium]|nr:hypothetical protein [Verrucomicrobiaceae bacterium]
MKTKFKIITGCTAALVYCAPLAAFAASPTPAASPKTSPAEKTTAAATTTKVRAIPFHGTISTVDQTAKTFTIAGKEKSRVFKIMDTTVITKAGAPATMTDVVANEYVSGSYFKAADGSLEAKSVKLGPKTDAEKKPSKKKSKKEEDASASPSPSVAPKP